MSDFLEFEEKTKKIKSINLDDLSVEDLKKYIDELIKDIDRVKLEMKKKLKLQSQAEKLFKYCLFAYFFYAFETFFKSFI